MSIKTVVSKADIIKALKTEPLHTGGHWIDPWENDNPTCAVCAVGATLRAMGLNNQQIRRCGRRLRAENTRYLGKMARESDVKAYLMEQRYMAALSAYYEGVARGDRAKTIAFVKAKFPDRIDLSNLLKHAGDTE